MSETHHVTTMGVEIDAQLLPFERKIRRFVLHSARKNYTDAYFNGNKFTIPPVNVVGTLPCVPARDADGDPIPGTHVIEDKYLYIQALGDEIMILDAAKAVTLILGITRSPSGQVSQAASRYAIGGLSLLPENPTKELWKDVCARGEKRAFLVDVDNARYVIKAHDEENARRRRRGDNEIAGDKSVKNAERLLAEYDRLMGNVIKEEVEEGPTGHDALANEMEMAAYVKLKISDLADSMAAKLGKTGADKYKIFQTLMDDPEVRQFAEKDYKIRKRGHLPVSKEELAAAVAAGAPSLSSLGHETENPNAGTLDDSDLKKTNKTSDKKTD